MTNGSGEGAGAGTGAWSATGEGSGAGCSTACGDDDTCASSALPAITAEARRTTATTVVPPIHFTASLMKPLMPPIMVNGQRPDARVPPGDALGAIVNGRARPPAAPACGLAPCRPPWA